MRQNSFGTLNILHGNGATIGREIVRHEKIKAISFTGGTKTGREIAKEASASLKRINLEMGGKNPVIIFDDCSYDKMMDSLLKSSFLNQGQICLAGSRIYVQKTHSGSDLEKTRKLATHIKHYKLMKKVITEFLQISEKKESKINQNFMNF